MISRACVFFHRTMANNNHERIEPMLSLENMPELVEMPEPKWRATVIGLLHEGQHKMVDLDDRMSKFEQSQAGIKAEMQETNRLAQSIANDTAEFRAFLATSKSAFKLFESLVYGSRWLVKFILLPILGIMLVWRMLNGKIDESWIKALYDFLN